MSKCLWTLNIGNFAPSITEITYPLMRHYARKIGAEFRVITERKFPAEFPIPYEKLQINELGRDYEWNIFLDADTLVHPQCIDFTEYMTRDTVAHNGQDFASVRWTYDKYFRRDGRNIGSCNWLAIASNWCLDLWKPLDDLTMQEAVNNITITVSESRCGVIDRHHLLDDYTLSRNIAKFGLKHTTCRDIFNRLFGTPDVASFWHAYTLPIADKTKQMHRVVKRICDAQGNPNGWGIRDILKNLIVAEGNEPPAWLDESADEGPIDGNTRESAWKRMVTMTAEEANKYCEKRQQEKIDDLRRKQATTPRFSEAAMSGDQS